MQTYFKRHVHSLSSGAPQCRQGTLYQDVVSCSRGPYVDVSRSECDKPFVKCAMGAVYEILLA